MGQQQLLLILLVAIVVGIATIVGMNIFGNAAKSAHKDEIIQEMNRMVADALAFRMRPAMLGGGNGSFMNFQPTGSDSFRGHIGNQATSPNTGGRFTRGDVNYFFEFWPEGGYPQRITIIASSMRYGQGNHWKNAQNARIVAYFDKDGRLIDNNIRQGYMVDGDW